MKIVAILCSLILSVTAVFAQITPIAQVKDTNNINISTKFVPKVAGRVSVADQFASTTFLQDASGGIALFIGNNTFREQFRSSIVIGDSIEIDSANLGEFQASTGKKGSGLLQLTSDANKLRFKVIPGTKVPPTPRNVTINSIGESVEGELLRLRNVHFKTKGAFQAGRTYSLENQNGDSVQVFIDRNTDIAVNNLSIPEDNFDFVGVLSQFRGTYQLQPRFASDLGIDFQPDTVSKNRTLDITTWNLNWFGSSDTTRGPKNKSLQFRNVASVMNSYGADIYALQEITTEEVLRRLRDTLNTLDAAANFGAVIAPIVQDQKMAYLYKQSTVKNIETGLAVNGGAQAWASGRFPFRMTINANIGGMGGKYILFVIHAKATSADSLNDLARRVADAETFREYLNSFYANDKVIVLGDFNDDVKASVVGNNPSPYKVFVDDTQNFSVLTKALSDKGIVSYPGIDGAMLDNIIVSNEVTSEVHRTKVEVPVGIGSYTTTTSDHYPVTMRLLPSAPTDVEEDNQSTNAISLRIAPNPAQSSAMMEIVNESEAYLRVRVVDMMGKEVMSLFEGQMSPQIRFFTLPLQELASGVYSVQVIKNNTILNRQITVVR